MRNFTDLSDRYDVVIVGARAAGAATALLLARQGLRVLAVDRGRYGADTLSTLALMRGGVLQLARWGLLEDLHAADTPVVRRTTFHYGERQVPVEIRPKDGIEGLYAPRRTVLDPLLVDAARAAGAEIVHGVRMVNLLRMDRSSPIPSTNRLERLDWPERSERPDPTAPIQPIDSVAGVLLEGPDGELRAIASKWVVGADGWRSPVARLAGARTERVARNRSGVIYGYWSGLGNEGYQWHYAPGVAAGVIPTNGGQSCVFAALPGEQFDELHGSGAPLASVHQRVIGAVSPALAAQLERAERAGSLHGFRGEPGFLRQAWGPGWALVGDAGYFKDPITSHGLTDALRDAELLARALVVGTDAALDGYQRLRDQLSDDVFALTDTIAGYDWTLDEVEGIHRQLSEAMKPEVAALRELDGAPAARRSA